jgi:hypothetical protein
MIKSAILNLTSKKKKACYLSDTACLERKYFLLHFVTLDACCFDHQSRVFYAYLKFFNLQNALVTFTSAKFGIMQRKTR